MYLPKGLAWLTLWSRERSYYLHSGLTGNCTNVWIRIFAERHHGDGAEDGYTHVW